MEYGINRPLTDDLIEQINNLPSGSIISFKNTVGLKASDFKKINSNIKIRIIGGLDEKAKPKYNASKYYNRTIYTSTQVIKILEQFEIIESHIDTSWNDLEKAMYVYKILCEGMEYDYDEKYGLDDKNRNLCGMLTHMSVCAGFGMIYKEFMDRLGIECDYQNQQHSHAWNAIKIDGVWYPIDLTWDVGSKSQDGKCLFRYFGNDPLFFSNEYHKGTNEMVFPSNTFSRDKLLNAISKIDNKKVSSKQGIKHVNRNGKEIVYYVEKRKNCNQLFIIYDGKLKTVFYKNDSSLTYLLDFDYSNNNVFIYGQDVLNNLKKISNNVRIITRADGTELYIEDSLSMVEDKNQFVVSKYDNFLNSFLFSNIISEEKLSTNSKDASKEYFIANQLLSDSRLKSKIEKFGGYVGFVRKEYGKFIKTVDGFFEEKISGIKRF